MGTGCAIGRHRRGGVVGAGLARLAMIAALGSTMLSAGAEPAGDRRPLPGFHLVGDADARKRQFFEYLRPLVEAENQRVLAQRDRLLAIVARRRAGDPGNVSDRRFLRHLAAEYRLDAAGLDDGAAEADLYRQLLRRVDAIPASLVLAQAAKESGWGASRFARLGNNLFGERCFERGCGLVPRQRAAGRIHEVERFDSVRASVASYLRNLNAHAGYQALRSRRERLRELGLPLSGVDLAEGLVRYSERGTAYVREVQALIRENGLDGTVAAAAGGDAAVSGQ